MRTSPPFLTRCKGGRNRRGKREETRPPLAFISLRRGKKRAYLLDPKGGRAFPAVQGPTEVRTEEGEKGKKIFWEHPGPRGRGRRDYAGQGGTATGTVVGIGKGDIPAGVAGGGEKKGKPAT